MPRDELAPRRGVVLMQLLIPLLPPLLPSLLGSTLLVGSPHASMAVLLGEPAAQVSTEALIARSDELRSNGEFEASARALDDAYRQMSTAQKIGALGRLVVIAAHADYERALEHSDHNEHSDQLAARDRTLVRDYIAEFDAARSSGRATAPPDDQERALRVLLRDAARSHLRPEDYELPSRHETKQTSTDQSTGSPSESGRTRSRPRRSAHAPIDTLTGSLLGIGSAALCAGAALVGVGASFPRQLDEARRRALTRYEYTTNDPLPASWQTHETRERRQGIALLTSGSILAGLGIVGVAWGAARTRRLHSRRTSLRPELAPDRVVVGVRHDF